ncbi:S-layer homology domain-containing protein [Paenibacillus sp. LHD-38]|uniref:S-layer homology domain-containing protein n=1 Tax=Paenibacillus sp. LHD-38 TaxID=3072143 RepID=UPI00280EA68E|nr:S-layer homology domain-containing protein [Paenibacillus sp. LHD-38]MDQ8736422.1 S-layer homology domain-containing protein [Paenibacillus sp. LHD-38]
MTSIKRSISALLACLLVILIVTTNGTSQVAHGEAQNQGTIYYVDASNGNDASEGTGTGGAWKTLDKVNSKTFEPGDRILFKRGESWSGTLHPKGNGEADQPIVIDSYGDQADLSPLINGNGNEAAVYLYNQQYWEIYNLEITNDDGSREDINSRTKKNGIYIVNDDAGTLNHIYIIGNNVHDVYGNNTKDGNGSSGIKVRTIAGDVPSNYNDILIDENTVGPRVDRTGIDINSDYWCRPDSGCTGPPNWYPSHNVVIQNNFVQDVGGDGIVPMATEGAIVQNNTVGGFNMRSGTVNAGIWAWNADNTIIQFNEAYNGHTTLDGQGFDIDYGQTGTIVQYNYSHDNDGGFILICQPSGAINDGGIVRYNISQNDKERVFQLAGPTTNTQIYNNTIYLENGSTTKPIYASSWDGYTKSAAFYNNLFYLEGAGEWQGLSNIASFEFDHNTIFGVHSAGEPADANKSVEDPRLALPGSGALGRDTVDGYMLAEDSPVLGTGRLIPNNGGLDYWGNALSGTELPNRGAYNGIGIDIQLPVVEVEGIEAEHSRVVLQIGESAEIPIRVLPANATDKTFTLTNDNEMAANVTGDFGSVRITAMEEGEASLTIVSNDGDFREMIRVKVVPVFQYENKHIANPGFENEQLAPWGSWKTGSAETTEHARSGEKAGQVDILEGSLEQKLSNLRPNTTYVLTAYGKVTDSLDKMDIGVKDYGAGQVVRNIGSLDYSEATFKFTTGPESTSAAVFCYRWNGNAPVYCDDFSLSEYAVGIHVDEQKLDLSIGEQKTIDAVVLPFNIANRSVIAEIADPAIADVTVEGGKVTVKAKAAGAAKLTLTSVDGGKMVELDVKIAAATTEQPPVPGPVTVEPKPNPTIQLVNAAELQRGADGEVTIALKPGKIELSLPRNIADILNGEELTVKATDVALTIPAKVLKETAKLTGDLDLPETRIHIRVEQQEEALEVDEDMRPRSGLYDFRLYLKTADGKEHVLTAFSEPVEAVFEYDEAGTDEELLGLYYHNEVTKAWEYVGGEIDRTNGGLLAELDHFSSYAAFELNRAFVDVASEHWAFRTLQILAAKHLVNGVTEGMFNPGDPVTRAEFASLAARALKLESDGSASPFVDVDAEAWYADSVSAAYEAGLVQGKSSNEFMPEEDITREQMAVVLARAYIYKVGLTLPESDSLQAYADKATVSPWARNAVNGALEAGLLQGRGQGRFAPSGTLTRAEAAQAIWNLMNK